jgi:CspA family cold shock protein
VNGTSTVGTVKWFDEEKAFGFIGTPDGDVFVHKSGIAYGMKLAAGDSVQFDIVPDQKSGRCKATNVRAA